MTRMVSFGANFVKVYDEDEEIYLVFRCKDSVIMNDRVVEEAKGYALRFVDESDIDYLYKLHSIGWYLHSIESI